MGLERSNKGGTVWVYQGGFMLALAIVTIFTAGVLAGTILGEFLANR